MRPAATPRGRRPLVVAAFSAGWLLVAAATAGTVVAVGHGSDGSSPSAAATAGAARTGPDPTASASGSATPGDPTPGGPGPTGSSSPPAPSTPSTTPKPVSTVTGKVASGLHSGDIRFFLLPVPSDASVIGDANGKTLTKNDVASEYQNPSVVLKDLEQLGFKDGAYRDYQTGDAKYHVVSRLWHFATAQSAKTWFGLDKTTPTAKAFPVSGFPDAKGWYIAPPTPGATASLRGLYYSGDTVFEIFVIGEDPIDKGVLAGRMRPQVARLATGG